MPEYGGDVKSKLVVQEMTDTQSLQTLVNMRLCDFSDLQFVISLNATDALLDIRHDLVHHAWKHEKA